MASSISPRIAATTRSRIGKETMAAPEPGYKPYPGGHFLAYDMASGKFERLADAPPQQGIVTMNMDTKRGRLYGLTWPSGYFLRYDMETRELKNLGPISREGEAGERANFRVVCRSFSIDPNDGSVYFTTSDGDIMRYRYDRDAIEKVQGDDLRKDYFGSYDPSKPGLHGIQLAPVGLGTHRRRRSTRCMAIPATCSASTLELSAWTCRTASLRSLRNEAACSTVPLRLPWLYSRPGRAHAVLSDGRCQSTRTGRRVPRRQNHHTWQPHRQRKPAPDYIRYPGEEVHRPRPDFLPGWAKTLHRELDRRDERRHCLFAFTNQGKRAHAYGPDPHRRGIARARSGKLNRGPAGFLSPRGAENSE